MYISRIIIRNFRNFREVNVPLSGDVVIVGENRVGKSNLLFALRLIFDPTLPDSARQLGLADFWDGIEAPDADDKITVAVDIKDFEDDLDILAVLTEYRLDDDAETVRLTYECRPKIDLLGDSESDDDLEFVCFGGQSETKRFGHALRRRVPMDLLPALRDAEADLSTWRRSPLRPLIENAFKDIDKVDLQEVSDAIEEATNQISDFDQVGELETSIATLFSAMSGPRQDIKPRLGFAPLDARRLYRNIKLLIDEGVRGIADASLGSANLVFLSLKALELKNLIDGNKRDHSLLAIEEPEAHLHPHLQRSVYRHLFETVGDEQAGKLSVILTTHSPHIVSVAPLRSILLLKDTTENGTIARSTASLSLSDGEVDDLTRYLDVTRAEMLFSRGVILVEGEAERFLIPEFAKYLDVELDSLGISICSVAGTNFRPYAKLLTALGIPFSIITDWDPRAGAAPLGKNRSKQLAFEIERTRTGTNPAALSRELNALDDFDALCERCEDFGIFSNLDTLEVDLFNDGFHAAIIDTLNEVSWSAERTAFIAEWEEDANSLDRERYLAIIDDIGKGRFAQRLCRRIEDLEPPTYIADAINFVAERV